MKISMVAEEAPGRETKVEYHVVWHSASIVHPQGEKRWGIFVQNSPVVMHDLQIAWLQLQGAWKPPAEELGFSLRNNFCGFYGDWFGQLPLEYSYYCPLRPILKFGTEISKYLSSQSWRDISCLSASRCLHVSCSSGDKRALNHRMAWVERA